MISVIVATHNRRHLLERTLLALAEQDWPRADLEVIVVDNGSTDDTSAWIDAERLRNDWTHVVVLHESRPGKSHAVNRAVSCARGEYLLFIDDDVVPERRWVSSMVRAMKDTGADFGVGRILPLWEAPPPNWLSPSLYGVLAIPDNGVERLPIGVGCNEQVMPIGANMAVRAEVIRRVGGWRSDLGKLRNTLRSGEDHEFYVRMLAAGLRGVYEPSARVAHLVPAHRLTRRYFRQWMRDNGKVVASIDRFARQDVPRLFSVPRYLWRDAFADVSRLLTPRVQVNPSARFAVVARLVWFAGFLRGTWHPDRSVASMPPLHVSTRPESARVWQEQ